MRAEVTSARVGFLGRKRLTPSAHTDTTISRCPHPATDHLLVPVVND
jgi:hypothetical protein